MEADVWSPLGSSSWSATSACGRGLWLPASACGRVRSCVSEPKASTNRKDRAAYPLERGRGLWLPASGLRSRWTVAASGCARVSLAR